MASVSGVGGSAGGSGGSDGSGGTGTAAIRGISKTSRGKKKVAKRVVNDPSLMPMPSIGTSGGAIPLYPEVPVEPYTLDEIMDPGCVDCYNRIVIIPEGDGYLPFKSSAKAIAEVIQEKYKKPWLSWGEIKEDKTPQIREVDQFLHCFKTKCTWKREHDAAVLASFDHRFSKRLSSMLAYARNKGEEKRPNWIGENVWTALWRKWNTDAYKQKREKAKTNRASERGTSTHKGGSMSAGEIKYYMEKQLGREVTQAEIHRYLHVNPETNEYTDELSKNIQEQLQQIMKEWDDHQATLPPAQRAGPVQRKQYETASFMHISGGKYKGRVLGAGSLSSTFKKGPTGYIQTETSSSYASTDRSHRPSIDNDLDQLKKQWASEQEEKTQQLIQAAIDKLNEEWKQKFQEQQQQFQQQQQQFQQQQFSFPPVFHQQFPPRPQYLPQQPLFRQQQNYSQYSQQQQPPPNFQQQHQDPPNSAFQQVQQQPPMFQQQQYFHNYPYVPSSSHQIPQPQPDHQTAYRPTMPTAGLIRPDLNQPQPARAPHSTSGGAIEDEIQFQTMMSPPTQIHNTFEGLLSSGMAGNNDGVSGADQRNYYED